MVKAFHCPNQTRNATEAFFNKKMGVLPGVSDLIIGWNRKLYGGAGIGVLELKAETGRVSSSQNKFLSWADSIGWDVGMARAVGEAHIVLKSWGLKPVHNAVIEPDYRTQDDKFKQMHAIFAPSNIVDE